MLVGRGIYLCAFSFPVSSTFMALGFHLAEGFFFIPTMLQGVHLYSIVSGFILCALDGFFRFVGAAYILVSFFAIYYTFLLYNVFVLPSFFFFPIDFFRLLRRIFENTRVRGQPPEHRHNAVHQRPGAGRPRRQHAAEDAVPVLPKPVLFRLRRHHPGRAVQTIQRRSVCGIFFTVI